MSDTDPLSAAATAEMPVPGGLIACPICDLLLREAVPPRGGRISCPRCDAALMTNRPGAIDRTLASALATLILMTAAMTFPFLELTIAGLHSYASVIGVALAFRGGEIAPLSVAIALLIIVIPLIRATALAYVLVPLRLGRPPAPRAESAFRIARELKPWSMAEVFLIGVVVALVKIAGMASISLGPAFWALAGLVVLVVLEGVSLCEWTIWRVLEDARRTGA